MRLAAARALGASSDPNTKQVLLALLEKSGTLWAEPDDAVRAAASDSLRGIEGRLAWGENIGRVFTGISLGSVLLLAALGLAITYGVMGVINMAHGELLMIGAYSAFATQSVFRAKFPAYIDWYVIAAIPVAFLAAAAVGMLMERLVDPSALRPSARNAARDLGAVADPDPERAHDLRAAERRGRQSVVDVGRHRRCCRTSCCRTTGS